MFKNPELLPASPLQLALAALSKRSQRRVRLEQGSRRFAAGTVGLGGNLVANSNRRPSDSVWGDCPQGAIREGSWPGVFTEDDFQSGGLITSPTTEAALVGIPYQGFGSAATTHTFADEVGGVLAITQATDNLAGYAKNKVPMFQISSNKGRLWYETRIKVNAITNNQIGFLCGLMDDTAQTVVVPLSTANPPIFATTGNFVGFWGREQDAGAVMSTYVAAGVASVAVQATVHQFVADTYVKLGMKFNPKDPFTGAASLSFWVNGVRQGTSKTIPNATSTDFPATSRLNWTFGIRLGASTSSIVSCDWVKVFQEILE